MAINKNHEFEELNGIKCGIVERNAKRARTEFLKEILEYNSYTVIIVPSPPPKTASPPLPATGEEVAAPPETFTIGVTDYTFNPVNAIFGRTLQAPGGHVVTLAFWNQEEAVSRDEVPYYEKR